MNANLLLACLARIEQKLDTLIQSLAEDDDEGSEPALTLDGQTTGRERNQDQPL